MLSYRIEWQFVERNIFSALFIRVIPVLTEIVKVCCVRIQAFFNFNFYDLLYAFISSASLIFLFFTLFFKFWTLQLTQGQTMATEKEKITKRTVYSSAAFFTNVK